MKHRFKLNLDKTNGTNHYVFDCVRCGSEHGIIKWAFQMMGDNPTWRGNIAYWSRWKLYDDSCISLEPAPGLADNVLMIWFFPSKIRR